MKFLKRAIILLTLTIAGWIVYANYHQIDVFDYDKVINKIAADFDNLLRKEEEQALFENTSEIDPPLTEEKKLKVIRKSKLLLTHFQSLTTTQEARLMLLNLSFTYPKGVK